MNIEYRDYTPDPRPIPGIEEAVELDRRHTNGVDVMLYYVRGTLDSYVTVDDGKNLITHPVPEGVNPMDVFARPGKYHES